VKYGSIGGLEYEVPQKLTHLLQCTHMLHNFWTSTHRRGELPPPSGGATGPGYVCIVADRVGSTLGCRRRAARRCQSFEFRIVAAQLLNTKFTITYCNSVECRPMQFL